jgi:hypothetical protein
MCNIQILAARELSRVVVSIVQGLPCNNTTAHRCELELEAQHGRGSILDLPVTAHELSIFDRNCNKQEILSVFQWRPIQWAHQQG